jgi:nucleoside-diphosphate-sugar epimerase
MSTRVLVTGANGCIGAWVIRRLLADGDDVVALDAGDDDRRLRTVLHGAERRGALEQVRADIRDLDALRTLVRERGVERVIHLAALQVPFARADPPLGAAVNVVGTVNLFQAVKDTPAAARPLVYASSVAVYQARGGAPGDGLPDTHYGVYKRANEGNARIFWRDDGIPSIGLRPHVVYGVGRDQGLTSSPTVAMLHAAAGRGHRIPYGGSSQMHFVEDAAAVFVAASRAAHEGALVADLGGPSVSMADVVAAIERAAGPLEPPPSFEDTPLPFPAEVGAGDLEGVLGPLPRTPLDEGVGRTIEAFRRLLAAGLLAPPEPAG